MGQPLQKRMGTSVPLLPPAADQVPSQAGRLPPTVVIEEAWAGRAKLGGHGRTSAKAGSNTFDFTFTALSLSAPEKQRFKYRLEPYDKDWVDAGARRTAHYTNMVPGEYSFHVIAANSFGIWNERGATVVRSAELASDTVFPHP
jgi:hypothetical protein